ncbi:HAD-like domain-containing protein [Tricladium varicosporioides]|nr:HAD-like domain-containing protein [Hymenoscyphus varicosporioides]
MHTILCSAWAKSNGKFAIRELLLLTAKEMSTTSPPEVKTKPSPYCLEEGKRKKLTAIEGMQAALREAAQNPLHSHRSVRPLRCRANIQDLSDSLGGVSLTTTYNLPSKTPPPNAQAGSRIPSGLRPQPVSAPSNSRSPSTGPNSKNKKSRGGWEKQMAGFKGWRENIAGAHTYVIPRPSSPISRALPGSRTSIPSSAIRQPKVPPSDASGGIPNPTADYLYDSSEVPHKLDVPKHLLVIIDLNGTILFRPHRNRPKHFTARPHAQRFLEYCINTFNVVIWSSAKPQNVKHLVEAIIPEELRRKVLAIWGRDKFCLTPRDYDLRVQCYKRLTKVWNDAVISKSHPEYATGGRWNQRNTVLVDDSIEKGRSEPFNIIEIPEFHGDMNEPGDILPQVHDYLNHLSLHSNVSACLRVIPFRPKLLAQ